MIFKILVVVVIVFGLWWTNLSTPSKNAPTPTPIVTYSCDNKKTIEATYLNTAGQVALKLSDGRIMTLDHAMSADGARYATPDESIVFWSRGDTAFMTEGDKTTYQNCNGK